MRIFSRQNLMEIKEKGMEKITTYCHWTQTDSITKPSTDIQFNIKGVSILTFHPSFPLQPIVRSQQVGCVLSQRTSTCLRPLDGHFLYSWIYRSCDRFGCGLTSNPKRLDDKAREWPALGAPCLKGESLSAATNRGREDNSPCGVKPLVWQLGDESWRWESLPLCTEFWLFQQFIHRVTLSSLTGES